MSGLFRGIAFILLPLFSDFTYGFNADVAANIPCDPSESSYRLILDSVPKQEPASGKLWKIICSCDCSSGENSIQLVTFDPSNKPKVIVDETGLDLSFKKAKDKSLLITLIEKDPESQSTTQTRLKFEKGRYGMLAQKPEEFPALLVDTTFLTVVSQPLSPKVFEDRARQQYQLKKPFIAAQILAYALAARHRDTLNLRVGAYNDLAYYWLEADKPELAFPILTEVLKANPNRTVAYLNYGDIYNLSKSIYGINPKTKSDSTRKYYSRYVELMTQEGKTAKIPTRVKDFLLTHSK